MTPLRLQVLAERFAVCRLPPDSPIPPRPQACGLWSATLTGNELSLVLPESAAPPGVPTERGWRALEVAGPLDFALTGVMASLSSPLAAAGISLFVVSTYDTDYVLVRDHDLGRAKEALEAAGHQVAEGPGGGS
ncbi:MAG TPA: ACT domain-containing protein [Thermoanaerobaculia bacterium]|nr:ACT domain-containing protein [Thermoanaerobaculia bacterium]